MENLPDAWILTVGNEIINGVITDTNRETIARELRSVGISIKGMSSVGDDPDAIIDALRMAMDKAVVTMVSGGLGPTEDDKTSASAASFLGVPLRLDQEQLARIEERFRRWNRPMALTNTKQALFPEPAVPIPNDYGTAPGFMIEKDGRLALFFPGVPSELVRMLRETRNTYDTGKSRAREKILCYAHSSYLRAVGVETSGGVGGRFRG